jgi:hypothetical protein
VPPALNANAMVMCSHAGQFKFVPTVGSTVMLNGAPALVATDIAAPMSPCPFATAAGPAPCVQLTPPLPGTFSMKVFVKGQPVMLQSTQWMTIPAGAGVPVPAMVTSPGNMTVQVNG